MVYVGDGSNRCYYRPLIASIILYFHNSYKESFAIFLIPALCSLVLLAVARKRYPRPQDLEIKTINLHMEGFKTKYWLFIAAICCIAAGYVDFSLIAYHFEKEEVISRAWVPAFFSLAMAADGLSGLIFGRLYDKKGISVFIVTTVVASLFAPLAFFGGFYLGLIGMLLWGIGTGAHETIMRAMVANIVSIDKRGTGFGIMNMWFGVSWFLGSAIMGYFYDVSLLTLVIFSLTIQLASIPFLLMIRNKSPSA